MNYFKNHILLAKHIVFKTFAYHVIRMEEQETNDHFFFSCGKMCNALKKYDKINDVDNSMTISQTVKFLHKYAIKNGGDYSENERLIGNHFGSSPGEIKQDMEILDEFYVKYKKQKNISLIVYYMLQTIHPFGDGNGRCGKALIAILENNYICKIKTKKQHNQLCKTLQLLQTNYFKNYFNNNMPTHHLKKLLQF